MDRLAVKVDLHQAVLILKKLQQAITYSLEINRFYIWIQQLIIRYGKRNTLSCSME
jgi:hypothetical protein